MENILDVTVILPVKSALSKDFNEYFTNAVNSLKNQKTKIQELLVVATQEEHLQDFFKTFDFEGLNHRILTWDGVPNFASQIDYGVKNSTTKWLSILEFDDEYSSIWFDNVMKYEHHYNDVEVFLPIVVDTNEKGVFAGFTNESVFAANFAQEMGFLTNDILQDYQNFQTSGMVFKKSVYENFGGFKPSIKLTFVYELFLRWTYNSVKIMSIPRIGYKHANMREGSLFWNYKNGEEQMIDEEVKFWVQTAKKEYFFTDDRSIKYESSND
jgi:hypothetical protein